MGGGAARAGIVRGKKGENWGGCAGGLGDALLRRGRWFWLLLASPCLSRGIRC